MEKNGNPKKDFKFPFMWKAIVEFFRKSFYFDFDFLITHAELRKELYNVEETGTIVDV